MTDPQQPDSVEPVDTTVPDEAALEPAEAAPEAVLPVAEAAPAAVAGAPAAEVPIEEPVAVRPGVGEQAVAEPVEAELPTDGAEAPAEAAPATDGAQPALDEGGAAAEEQIAAAVATDDGETAPAPVEESTPVAADAVPVTVVAAAPSKRRRRLRIAAVFVASFLIAALIGSTVGAAAMYAYRSAYDGRVPQGVDVGGINISGLDSEAARALVAAQFSAMSVGRVVLDAPSGDRIIDYSTFGRSVDAAGAVDRAMAIARGGGLLDETLASARTAIDGVSIAPTVALDIGLLRTQIDRAAITYELPPVNAVVVPTADGAIVEPARNGRTIDREAILAMIFERVADPAAPAQIVIPVEQSPVVPAVTDQEAETARQAVDKMGQPIVLRHGDERWKIAAKTVRSWLEVETTPDGRIVYDVDRDRVGAAIEKLRGKVDRKATNARYLTSNSGRVVGVRASKNGRKLDTAVTSERVARAVISRAYGVDAASATAVVQAVAPKLSTAEAQKTAPLLKMISGHTTWFPYGERNYYGANIWIPGRIINGMVLAPGETFNFFKVVGFPSASRGFGMGGAIINGKSEPTGALAGGICSCSTTLFNAAAKAGLKLGARAPHYYYIDRYPLGLDATVLFSSGGGGQNMTFTNDTKYPILIVNRNWRVGGRGYVRFEMWSVPNGRKVRFSRPIVKNIRQAGTDVVYTSALRPGASRVEETGHNGMDVWVTRTVTDANGKVSKQTIYSHYRRVDALILRGKPASGANL